MKIENETTCKCLKWKPLKVDDMMSSRWLPIRKRTSKEVKRIRVVSLLDENDHAMERHVW